MMQLHLQVLQHQLLRMVMMDRWRLKQCRERLLHLLLRAHRCRVVHGRFSPFHFKLLLCIIVYMGQHLLCCYLFLVLPFVAHLLHVILFGNVTCFRRFPAPTDQWKCKIFIFHAATIATLL